MFKAQIDPTTMLWKDLRETRDFDIQDMNLKAEQIPHLRPILSKVGSQL